MIRIGTGTSAVDPSALRVAGVSPSKIMLGTGSAAVEVWSASPYPATGAFEIVNGAAFQPYEVFSHTVVESGNFTATITRESGEVTAYQWTLNGGSATTGPTRTFTGLSVGDTIVAGAIHTGAMNLSGTWSVVKN